LIVNVNYLRKRNSKRAVNLLNEAVAEILALQRALKEYVMSIDAAFAKQFEEFHVGFEGSLGAKHVSPRTLTSQLIGNLVCVEGIVTKCSLIHPKVVKSVHYCPATGKTIERKYSDLTSLEPFPTSSAYPTQDDDGHPLETEYGLSEFKDHQTFSIQEMPEKAPAGQLPRSVDVIVDDDLVDICKPGDRVYVVGGYRCLPSKKGGYTSGTFRTILIANHIMIQSKEILPTYTAKDVRKIKKFSRSKQFDVYEVLARSLAPSIHGHEHVKRAVLCMLLGGVEKILDNGTRLRGDVNLLLIGDPSTAKSQMLRFVLQTAPRAVTTTGRGSSGVGLTAAITTDQETGDRRLEAGAMVLADRGVVCIDEFDKMSDIDRTAIHEVMEQGRVTIAKAGIHARLNARCSVLAAANPVYGRYDEYKSPMDNIGMQDSLLSRFDLIFIVLDEMEPANDKRISEHVLRMHRYRNPGEQDGEVVPIGGDLDVLALGIATAEEEEENDDTPVFDSHDELLHGIHQGKNDLYVSKQFLRKYIHVARNLKPTLTREACDLIATEYTKLRAQDTHGTDKAKTQPVTARALETLIRLSTAHAKARMTKTITAEDAEAAIELVNFAYFKKVTPKPKKKVSKEEGSGEEEKRVRKRSSTDGKGSLRPKKKPGEPGYDPYDFDSDDEGPFEESGEDGSQTMDTTTLPSQPSSISTPSSVDVTDKKFSRFKTLLFGLFSAEHSQSLPIEAVSSGVNAAGDEFSPAEVTHLLNLMQDANQVMVSEGMVFLI
jgi:DNA replication licensing factor MCM3